MKRIGNLFVIAAVKLKDMIKQIFLLLTRKIITQKLSSTAVAKQFFITSPIKSQIVLLPEEIRTVSARKPNVFGFCMVDGIRFVFTIQKPSLASLDHCINK